MGLLDNVKAKLGPAKDKVSGLAQQHGDKVRHGLDKAAKVVDEKTKGKYSDKIEAGTGKAKGAVDRLAHKDGTHPGGTGTGTGPVGDGGTPSASPPPGSPPPPSPPPTSPPVS
ncbi:antitoxin [Streptomyces sp. ALI-76-A]|uniref:antitoxin n=1 Tax=Streptomyces sp. ALI-76-A TaxID=3025736 RepID=UPI00256EA740|nr:antitoxin [Streptomyces sp. ALI-76-A]MDL5204188.1 antitoxin [Streptomyces sp. ALI-76-A]